MTDECLMGEVTAEQVVKWTQEEWRVFQYRHMLATNIRLSKLENQAAWRNVLISVPWAIVGALVVALVKM